MSTFQQLSSKIFAPATSRPELKDRAAIVQLTADGERQVSYAQFEQLINAVAHSLQNAGVKEGSRVVLCGPNTPELAAGIIAAWSLGALAVPVDFRMTDGELQNVSNRVKAQVLASSRVVSTSARRVDPKSWVAGADAPCKSSSVPSPSSPGLVILTSGTTGIPKGAEHDLGSLFLNLEELGEHVKFAPSDRGFLPLPISHVLGLEVLMAVLMFGGSIVFADFSPENFADQVSKSGATIVVGVPTIYGALVAMPVPPGIFSKVRIFLCGGAPLPSSLAEAFHQKFDLRISQGYGSTEAKIIAVNVDGPTASIGRTIPSVKIDIVDENDKLLPEGSTGELRISGLNLMLCYLDQTEETAKVMHDGHYHTGDIGHIKDGYVFISGRSKEMIIVAGNKIFPAELESTLRQHPLSKEVAVFGIPHRQLGQMVKAVVVVSSGELSDLLCGGSEDKKRARQELLVSYREFSKEHLKRELRPMDWEFRPESCPLPKTNTGKVDKKQLEIAHA